MHRFGDILLSSPSKFVHVSQIIKPSNPTGVHPIQPYQLHTRRDHLIRMAIQGSMDQDIPRGGAYAAGISGLLEAARKHYGCVRAQMAMTRQTEAARQSVDAGLDAAKSRIVDC